MPLLFNDDVTADPEHGNRIFASIAAGGAGTIQLTIATVEGKELIAAETTR